MSGVAGRISTVAAAIVLITLISSCGLVGGKETRVTESSHEIRDQCNRTLNFFENILGITDTAIGYGSINPEDKIDRGAMCTVTKSSVGVGGTRLSAMLSPDSEPAPVRGDPSYIAQTGYDDKVWLNQSPGSVRIYTTVDGWEGSLDLNVDQINQVSITSGEQPNFEVSDHEVRAAAKFLIELTRELT
ncbi:hypothetical protein [Nocardia fusca]|uniref:hypothetical protein n=1 Tax=Nocardia fusca TaxID=941183 RepID=UPI0012F4E964|nr:hypothetical protein [Nocardia fusca]